MTAKRSTQVCPTCGSVVEAYLCDRCREGTRRSVRAVALACANGDIEVHSTIDLEALKWKVQERCVVIDRFFRKKCGPHRVVRCTVTLAPKRRRKG